MFEFVKSFGAIIISYSMPENINNDPTVWLDGARPPSKYVFKNNMSLSYFNIDLFLSLSVRNASRSLF
jgi:hypothetical protein